MAKHLFCSDSSGALYDTRRDNWSLRAPLRAVFKHSFREIENLAQLKATLRAGAYAWPGGYPLYFIAQDGEALSFDSVRENWREIVSAFCFAPARDWRVIGCEINYEDGALYCAHSGKRIASAYAEDEAEDLEGEQ